jgi:hypothetical protein
MPHQHACRSFLDGAQVEPTVFTLRPDYHRVAVCGSEN